MALSLQDDAIISTVSLPAAQPGRLDAVRGAIPDSGNVSGLEVRLSQLHIKDNHTPRVPPFPGYANLYLLVVVIDDQMQEPRTLTLNSFPRVDDNEDLPVDRTVYYWKQEQPDQKPPCQVHVLVSVLKSKKDLRDTGQVLAAAQSNDTYKSLLQQVTAAIVKAPTQTVGLILQLGNVIGSALTDVEDKTLFTQVVSFTDINGDFDTLGKTPHQQENRYVASTLSIIVRDAEREQVLANLTPTGQPA
ncbi:hypothetical protein [Hymenobacter jeollabukensis]|uniref:Uncharacterized protein n=1 Tax=Hymenobacter jeollabukensis TaxID=2025313 RepID=A0A5R8WK80_9BACT|nr:hypothetical protein [Hymenobacter jeollabukensis]TLM89198.1 hypothetical protein FDY95_21755 [Hymenobacter jeollabukensis]